MSSFRFYFLTIALLFLSIVLSACSLTQTSSPSPSSNTAQQMQKIRIIQTINYGDSNPPQTTEIKIPKGQSALDAIKSLKSVKTKSYSIGTLVESIDGIKNGTDNKYWIYYVNGQESKIGADQYQLQENDSITWEFKAYEEQ